jgi:hypothetical protein
MISNRWVFGGALVLCLTWGAWAQQDPSEPPAETGEQVSPEPSPEEKSRWKEFFGDSNALYLEFGVAGGSFDDIDSSVSTSDLHFSRNTLSVDSILGGRAAIGWTLPFDRGRYVLAFEGFKEDAYEFEGLGELRQVTRSGGGFSNTSTFYQWWSVRASDAGTVNGTRNAPIWTDDNPANGTIDPGEISYGTPDLTFSSATTDTLKNTTQTWDLLYQRGWGGRRIRGAWSAGVRYYLYEGTVPAAAWLGTEAELPGTQYTDGSVTRLLPLSQRSEGWGPTGSGEAQYNFARGRVTIYLQGRVALLLQDMEVDSGPFVTYARDPAIGTILAPARLQESLDKTVWQLAGELGARIRVLPGTHLLLAYTYRGYLDSLLVPAEIQIPKTDFQASRGTVGLYKSLDLKIQSYHAGFSFQF